MRSVATSFLLVEGYAYSRLFCEFFVAVTVNIFSPVNKTILKSLDECSSYGFKWQIESSMEVRFAQLWVVAIFEHRRLTRYCSDEFKVWWDI